MQGCVLFFALSHDSRSYPIQQFSGNWLKIVLLFVTGINKAHLVSLLSAEANTVLDGEFIGGLARPGQSGWVTAVFEAAQVSWHCVETNREHNK